MSCHQSKVMPSVSCRATVAINFHWGGGPASHELALAAAAQQEQRRALAGQFETPHLDGDLKEQWSSDGSEEQRQQAVSNSGEGSKRAAINRRWPTHDVVQQGILLFPHDLPAIVVDRDPI